MGWAARAGTDWGRSLRSASVWRVALAVRLNVERHGHGHEAWGSGKELTRKGEGDVVERFDLAVRAAAIEAVVESDERIARACDGTRRAPCDRRKRPHQIEG